MNILIKYSRNRTINECIQFYIFSVHGSNEAFTYKTFPNTNLCLSLYKANTIITNINKTSNSCFIQTGNNIQSRLWGFHKQPFEVFVDSEMDQISVIFQPGALRKFTKIPYEELMQDTDVARTIFGEASNHLVEKLFSTHDFCERVALLDEFLLHSMRDKHKQDGIDHLLRCLDCQINSSPVFDLALSQHMDTSTLYRQFKYHVGQAPKEYLKVVRFRKALHAIQRKEYYSLTELTYDLGYYDQSHFIKEFNRFAYNAPGSIHKLTEIAEDKIIWIVNK